MGYRAEYLTQSQNRGLGGYDSSFDDKSKSSCSHATESGYPLSILNDAGSDGLNGATGVNGSAGKGSYAAYGSFRNGVWIAAKNAGNGGAGGNGEAGGGGGAGGGVAAAARRAAATALAPPARTP